MTLQTKILTHLFNLPYLPTPPKQLLPSYITASNCFGVFATIRRHTKLSSYPEDIHGCIGYWDDNYNSLSPDFILSKLENVAHSAMYDDSRHAYFPSIDNDILSIVELDFMMLPIIPISASDGLITGKPFINSEYGIIATNKLSRATYLPNVFPDRIEWNKLKASIKDKAGIQNNKNTLTKYYGYKIKQIKVPLTTLLLHPDYTIYLLEQYLQTICKYLLQHQFIPYSSKSKNNITRNTNIKLTHNTSEYVRNLSVLESILIYKYQKLHQDPKTDANREINTLILQLIRQFEKTINPMETKLVLAGLISLIHTWNSIFPIEKIVISKGLLQNLLKDIRHCERDFEFGQVIIAGLKHSPLALIKSIAISDILDIINADNTSETDKPDKPDNITMDSIFRMNWDSQVLKNLFNTLNNLQTGIMNNKSRVNIQQAITKMSEKYVKLLATLKLDDLETNQLAVLFEGLFNLTFSNASIKKLSSRNTRNTNNTSNTNNIYLSWCFKLFIALMKRWHNGLLLFQDNTARIDITVHFLDGLICCM